MSSVESPIPESTLSLDPSGIGEYIQHSGCLRYAALRFDETDELSRKNWVEAFQPLDALLSIEGDRFEKQVYSDVLDSKVKCVITDWNDRDTGQEANEQQFVDAVQDAAQRDPISGVTLLLQMPLKGVIEAFTVGGDSDLIAIWPGEKEGTVHIRVFDLKASWDEKTYQQAQTATYSILIEQALGAVDDIDYELSAGIITREGQLSPFTPDALSSFDRAPREADVRRLLDADGPLASLVGTELDDVEYRHGSMCHNCSFNESCYTKSIEEKDIRLLEISRAEQEVLREHGIETLDTLAALIPKQKKPRAYSYDRPKVRGKYRDLVTAISDEHSVGERIPELAQRAQVLIRDLNPNHPAAGWTRELIGTGNGSLPEDNPPEEMDSEIQQGSLIRCYLNVQKDYIRDRVPMLSARVVCTNYEDGTPMSFSHVVRELPESADDPDDTYESEERDLIERFFGQLFDAIQAVATLSGQGESAPVHWYLYTQQERDSLLEAVRRHESLPVAAAVRDILGMRGGIDQKMVSILQSEITQRHALRTPSTGLLPVAKQFSPPPWAEASADCDMFDLSYTREDGTAVNLRHAFRQKLFNYRVQMDRGENVTVYPGGKPDGEAETFYPARARFDASIPLEYIWAAEGIDVFDPEWTNEPKYKPIIENYRWVDDERKTRLSREDLKTLGEVFAHLVHKVERSITTRNTTIEKPPLDIPNLSTFTLGESSLLRGCREYLDLEYASSESDILSQYRQPIRQRILSGRAVPIMVVDAWVDDRIMKVTGKLIYDQFGFANPDRVASSTRFGGADGGSGDFMVATPLKEEDGELVEDVRVPDDILHSPGVSIQAINPRTGDIVLNAFPNSSKKEDKYVNWHRQWTTDTSNADDFNILFGAGELFILDEQVDDNVAKKAAGALEYAEQSSLHTRLMDVLTGSETAPTTNIFDDDAVDEFADWLEANYNPSPNPQQRSFITETTGAFALLQGPPGTGKTSGAISLALLARLYSFEQDNKPLRGVVTGASNKAIDEVLEDTAQALQSYYKKEGVDPLKDVKLVRITDSAPEDPLPDVEYVNAFNDKEAVSQIWGRLKRQAGLDRFTGGGQQHVLVFATQNKVLNLVRYATYGTSHDDALESNAKLFDLLAIDEASMCPLTQLFAAGSFMTDDSQVLVVGDHRQMSPVQKHDWANEDRRIIEETVPFLSTLDFFRFLRGETVDSLEDADITQPSADIPMTRLNETYRCHTDVADFLSRWVYQKDNIDYQSAQTDTITPPSEGTPGVMAALDPDAPLTVIVHNDEESKQSSYPEALMTKALLAGLPEEETSGIVTPHNAQKGLLKSMVGTDAKIDTVERFQGGQRDVMFLSATVSDPDFLDVESDFLLNPNRLNVALSRMKKKLVVIAPESLFRLMPADIDEYEDAVIWKGLYEAVCTGDPSWTGSLSEFVGEQTDSDVSVQVYTG
jgi:hypothetical protein